MRAPVLGVAAALMTAAASGCGMMSHDGGPDVAAYGATARAIGSAASSYASAANATVDPTGCHSAHASYAGHVRPMVDRMRSMSGAMDEHMASMGYGGSADMGCGADAMTAELDHHDAMACTSTSMPANHDEATRHASAMGRWSTHQSIRADQMGGMGGMMGGGGPMMDPDGATSTCHRNDDGTFTLSP